jgi:azurin
MTIQRLMRYASLALASIILLTACGGDGGASGGGGQLGVGTPGDQMVFDPTTLQGAGNAQLTVAFTNNATSLQHNWVLVNGGDDVAATVAQEGTAAGPENGYIPTDQSNIIAHTKLLNATEQDTVQFAAPAAGSYTYVCTVPGHYAAGMKGTLTVQ